MSISIWFVLLVLYKFTALSHAELLMHSPVPYYGQGTSLSTDVRILIASGPDVGARCNGVRTFLLHGNSEGTCSCTAPGFSVSTPLNNRGFSFSWTTGLQCVSQFDTPAGQPFVFTVRDYLWCSNDFNAPGNDSSSLRDVFLSPGFAPTGVIDVSFTQDPPFGDGPAPWYYYRVQIPNFNHSKILLNISTLFLDVRSHYTTNVFVLFHPQYPKPTPGFPLLPSHQFYTWSSNISYPATSSRIAIDVANTGSYTIAINCPKRVGGCGSWGLSATWTVLELLAVHVLQNGTPFTFNMSQSASKAPQLARFTCPYCYYGCFFRIMLRCPRVLGKSTGSEFRVYISRDSLEPSIQDHMHVLRCGQNISVSQSVLGWHNTGNVTGDWYFSGENSASTFPDSFEISEHFDSSSTDFKDIHKVPSLLVVFSPYNHDLADRPVLLFVNDSAYHDALFPSYSSFAQFSVESPTNVLSPSSGSWSSIVHIDFSFLENDPLLLLRCRGSLLVTGPHVSQCDTFACVGLNTSLPSTNSTGIDGLSRVAIEIGGSPQTQNHSEALWFYIAMIVNDRNALAHGKCSPTKPLVFSLRIEQYSTSISKFSSSSSGGSGENYFSSTAANSSFCVIPSSTGESLADSASNTVNPSPFLWLLLFLLVPIVCVLVYRFRRRLVSRTESSLDEAAEIQLINVRSAIIRDGAVVDEEVSSLVDNKVSTSIIQSQY